MIFVIFRSLFRKIFSQHLQNEKSSYSQIIMEMQLNEVEKKISPLCAAKYQKVIIISPFLNVTVFAVN